MISTKCRIVIALVDHVSFANILVSLYDLGIRKGDMLFLHHYRLSVVDLTIIYEQFSSKMLELLQRSLTVNSAEWIGNYGQLLKSQVEKVSVYTNNLGFSFDQTMLALHGIDHSITKGDNLENYTAVNANIRKQKFVGVTGTVSIAPDSNSRSTFYLNIFTILPVSNISQQGDEIVGNYSISGAQRFLLGNIVWPGETNVIPSDMRVSPIDCPFDYRLVQDSWKGKIVFFAIVVLLIIIESSLGVFQHKRWRSVKIETLKEPKMIKFGDILIMIILLVETLELISIGPDMRSYSVVISKSIRLLSPDWDGPMDINGDRFWIEVYVAVSIISFMVYSAWIIRKKYSEKYNNYFFELNELVSGIWIIFLCTIAYIPLLSILLSVFLCKESVGSKITDSFNCHDCYAYCWSGFHLSISILCLTILLLYMTLVIYFQPSWQLFHPIFNVIINPKTAVYKSALYFIMTGVNKNLLLVSKELTGIVYSLILLALAFSYWKVGIYNYPRMNMWAIFSIFVVIWSNVISIAFALANDGNAIVWELALVAGWFILGAAGIVLQTFKFPNLLISEKGVEMGILFKFILGSKICATDINGLKMTPRAHDNAKSNNDSSYAEAPLFVSSKNPDSKYKNEEHYAGSQWISDI